MPKGRRALDERHETVKKRACDRSDCDLGPDHVERQHGGLGRNPKAHAHRRRAEKLGYDRTDQRERRIDLQGVEDERQGRRQPLAEGAGRLTLDKVRVPGRLGPIDLEIAGGARVLVTGANGAGKSTLLRVIAGLATPSHGRVRLDGVRLDRLDAGALRAAVALVSPDLPLLRGSLRLNLSYGAPQSEEAALIDMLERCGLTELLARLPRGLDTRVAEGGAGLSSGERTRLGLARAMLVRPRILLLDEADAHLDPHARGTLGGIVANYPGTVVFASHQAEEFRAGRILRLERGGIVEDSDRSDAGAPAAGRSVHLVEVS